MISANSWKVCFCVGMKWMVINHNKLHESMTPPQHNWRKFSTLQKWFNVFCKLLDLLNYWHLYALYLLEAQESFVYDFSTLYLFICFLSVFSLFKYSFFKYWNCCFYCSFPRWVIIVLNPGIFCLIVSVFLALPINIVIFAHRKFSSITIIYIYAIKTRFFFMKYI